MQTCGIPSYKNAHEQDSATSATAASALRLSSVKAEIIAYRIARRNDYPGSCSSFVNAGLQLRVWSTPCCNHIGVSSSGKTQHFDCCITGSIPVAPVLPFYGVYDHVAQMVEQFKKTEVEKHPNSKSRKCLRFESGRGQQVNKDADSKLLNFFCKKK